MSYPDNRGFTLMSKVDWKSTCDKNSVPLAFRRSFTYTMSLINHFFIKENFFFMSILISELFHKIF